MAGSLSDVCMCACYTVLRVHMQEDGAERAKERARCLKDPSTYTEVCGLSSRLICHDTIAAQALVP